MERSPVVSRTGMFPTVIKRDGKWVVAVPIAISFANQEGEGIFGTLRKFFSPPLSSYVRENPSHTIRRIQLAI